jgi:hypothetical protein
LSIISESLNGPYLTVFGVLTIGSKFSLLEPPGIIFDKVSLTKDIPDELEFPIVIAFAGIVVAFVVSFTGIVVAFVGIVVAFVVAFVGIVVAFVVALGSVVFVVIGSYVA